MQGFYTSSRFDSDDGSPDLQLGLGALVRRRQQRRAMCGGRTLNDDDDNNPGDVRGCRGVEAGFIGLGGGGGDGARRLSCRHDGGGM